jgi:hypothetical protein
MYSVNDHRPTSAEYFFIHSNFASEKTRVTESSPKSVRFNQLIGGKRDQMSNKMSDSGVLRPFLFHIDTYLVVSSGVSEVTAISVKAGIPAVPVGVIADVSDRNAWRPARRSEDRLRGSASTIKDRDKYGGTQGTNCAADMGPSGCLVVEHISASKCCRFASSPSCKGTSCSSGVVRLTTDEIFFRRFILLFLSI